MAVGLWDKTSGMATTLAAEIKSLWGNAPQAPSLPLSDEKAKDQAIQDFLGHLKNNSAQDNKVLAQFVYAVSAVIVNQFNAKDADLERKNLVNELSNAPQAAPGIWETYREHAKDSLNELSSSSIDVKKAAVHYQLDNGLLTKNKTDDQTYANQIQDHIAGKTLVSPRDLVHHLLHLYLYGSRNNYNHTMSGSKKTLPPDEDALLSAFPKDRTMSTDAYYAAMPRIETAVDAFVKAQTGTNSSNNSVPALTPGAQPPVASVNAAVSANPPPAAPIVSVSPIAIPSANPSVIPVAAQPTPKQKTIKDEMNRLKTDVDVHEMELSLFENNIAKYQKELAALAGQPLEKADQFKQNISAEKEFKWDTHYLVVMKAHVDENAQIQTSAPPPVFDQASALQQIYDKAIDTFEDGKTGIKARAAKANAELVKLKTRAIGAVNAAVASLIKSFLSQMEAQRDDAKNEKTDAKTLRDQANVEYKTITGTDLKYHTKDQLLIEQKRMDRFKSGIKLKSSRVSSDGNIATKYYAKISDLSTTHPTAYMSSGGTVSLASADALKKEIAFFKADVDQYAQDVDNWIADVFSATKLHLAIEDAKIPFKASPPDPKKYGEDRIDQCNVWFHMFDAVRLTRSDRYRLAQLEAHPTKPWAINFASDLDTIRVLEAAVKSGRSNKMMDLKDMPNFYKMVENLVIATCEELKMAPPQPNSMDEQMLLFVATGASLHEGVQWAYSNDRIKAWEFTRLKQVVRSQVVDPVNQKIKLPDGTDANLLTQSRHLAQSAKAPKFIRIEEAY